MRAFSSSVMRKLVQPAMQQAVPHQFSISNFKRSPFGRTVFWARMALAMKRIASVFIYGFLRSGQT